MEPSKRIENVLTNAVALADAPGCPPSLAAAVRYSVFPGGARVRPRLCLAIAQACGDDQPEVSDAAAAAIELLHCASLVHDDLPCFDDAATRRGKPSVHKAYGERIAVLAGDALIVLAFHTLTQGAAAAPQRLSPLLMTIGRSVGLPFGIVAGQAWECEARVALARVSPRQDRVAVRGRRRRRRRRRGAAAAGRGARWARTSARPIRWPTTSATSPTIPHCSASRSARTRCTAARAPCANWAWRAPSRASANSWTARSSRFPTVPASSSFRASSVSRPSVSCRKESCAPRPDAADAGRLRQFAPHGGARSSAALVGPVVRRARPAARQRTIRALGERVSPHAADCAPPRRASSSISSQASSIRRRCLRACVCGCSTTSPTAR